MGSPLKVGVMDTIDIIRRCINTIWCKVVIQIIILFMLINSPGVVEGFCFRFLSHLMQGFCNIMKYLSYVMENCPEEECVRDIYSSMVSTILSSGTDLTAVCRRVNLTEWGRCSFIGVTSSNCLNCSWKKRRIVQ